MPDSLVGALRCLQELGTALQGSLPVGCELEQVIFFPAQAYISHTVIVVFEPEGIRTD